MGGVAQSPAYVKRRYLMTGVLRTDIRYPGHTDMVHMSLFLTFDYELGQLDISRSRTRFTFPASFFPYLLYCFMHIPLCMDY